MSEDLKDWNVSLRKTRMEHYDEGEKLLRRATYMVVPAAGPKRAEALRDKQLLLSEALVHASLACLPA
jgi:hypothetical protein